MTRITNERYSDHLYPWFRLFKFSSIGPICTLAVALGISPYRLLRLEKGAIDCDNWMVTVDGQTYKLPQAAVKALTESHYCGGVTLVFADSDLRPWDAPRFNQKWKETLRSAGIGYQAPDSLLPTVDLHLLDELHKHTHIHYGPSPKTGRLKRGPVSRRRKAGHRKLWLKPA